MSDGADNPQTAFDDLQNELAGRETGRMSRFLPASERTDIYGEKQGDKAADTLHMLNALERLLQDPDYEAAWNRANAALNTLQTKLTTLSDQLAARIEHLSDVTEDMEGRAAKLDDGTAIFRDENGQLVTADGRVLSAQEAADIDVPAGAPSWEEYKAALDALQKAREKQDRYSDIQRDITRWRDKLHDSDNPPTQDEVEEITTQIQSVADTLDASESATPIFDEVAHSSDAPDSDPAFQIDASIAP